MRDFHAAMAEAPWGRLGHAGAMPGTLWGHSGDTRPTPVSPELVVKVMYECSLGWDHMGNTHSLYIIPGVRSASCTEDGP